MSSHLLLEVGTSARSSKKLVIGQVEGGIAVRVPGRWVLIVATSLAVGVPAEAAKPDIVVAGSGSFSGACLTVVGASNHTADRWRWSVSYWPTASAPGPGGTCPENESHAEPAIACAEAVSDEDGARHLFLSGQGSDRKTYYVRILDRGPAGMDEVGVGVDTTPSETRCGADDLPLIPVSSGGFTVLPLTPDQ